jgi:hypothetical protein
LFASDAQQLAGLYHAQLNGDDITLDIQPKQSDGTFPGTMNDSYQSYAVVLQIDGNTVTGTATESTLGLTFDATGMLKGSKLDLNFSFEFNGARNSMDISFTKSGSAPTDISQKSETASSKLTFPQGAAHPPSIAGTWMKEELYQSGYGDNFMGAGFTQKMTFFPDGHIAEGASSSYMSGSYYSGQSYGDGDGVIPGLGWYTIGKTFYIQLTENGKTQNIPLGTFYVEGNNMMITASSGDKLLLTRTN